MNKPALFRKILNNANQYSVQLERTDPLNGAFYKVSSDTAADFTGDITGLLASSALVAPADQYKFRIGPYEYPLSALVRRNEPFSYTSVGSTVNVTTIVAGQNGLITTESAHGFTVGTIVRFAGSNATPTINSTPFTGQQFTVATVPSNTTFTLNELVTVGGTSLTNLTAAAVVVRASPFSFIKKIAYTAGSNAVFVFDFANTIPAPTSITRDVSRTIKVRLAPIQAFMGTSSNIERMQDLLFNLYISPEETTTTTPAEMAKEFARQLNTRVNGLTNPMIGLKAFKNYTFEYERSNGGNAYRNCITQFSTDDTFTGKFRITSLLPGFQPEVYMTSPDDTVDHIAGGVRTGGVAPQGTFKNVQALFNNVQLHPDIDDPNMVEKNATYDEYIFETAINNGLRTSAVGPGTLNITQKQWAWHVNRSYTNAIGCLDSLIALVMRARSMPD